MKKDEIIELLKEQIASLRADNDRLLLQVEALTQEIASLNEALLTWVRDKKVSLKVGNHRIILYI